MQSVPIMQSVFYFQSFDGRGSAVVQLSEDCRLEYQHSAVKG